MTGSMKAPRNNRNTPEVPPIGWQERVRALRNIPPVFRMVWQAAPIPVPCGVALRLATALIPVAMLAVTRVIVDAISGLGARQQPLAPSFWWFVALEFGLACLAAIFSRLIDYCDAVLADRYARHINVRIMEHASRIDLTCYEDPQFYDRMERARAQGTDRIGMINSMGRLVQQVITTASFAAGICLFSPWLLAGLVVCIVPAFL